MTLCHCLEYLQLQFNILDCQLFNHNFSLHCAFHFGIKLAFACLIDSTMKRPWLMLLPGSTLCPSALKSRLILCTTKKEFTQGELRTMKSTCIYECVFIVFYTNMDCGALLFRSILHCEYIYETIMGFCLVILQHQM